MLKKYYHHRTHYFKVYWMIDESRNCYAGILEEHDTDVKQTYFVAWKFPDHRYYPMTFQTGETKCFKDENEAIAYIMS